MYFSMRISTKIISMSAIIQYYLHVFISCSIAFSNQIILNHSKFHSIYNSVKESKNKDKNIIVRTFVRHLRCSIFPYVLFFYFNYLLEFIGVAYDSSKSF